MRRDGSILVLATPMTLKLEKFRALYARYGEGAIPLPCREHMCYYSIAESRGQPHGRGRCRAAMKKVTRKRVVEELAAIGFARATDFLCVSDGELTSAPQIRCPSKTRRPSLP